jgi:hypothetical protein
VPCKAQKILRSATSASKSSDQPLHQLSSNSKCAASSIPHSKCHVLTLCYSPRLSGAGIFGRHCRYPPRPETLPITTRVSDHLVLTRAGKFGMSDMHAKHAHGWSEAYMTWWPGSDMNRGTKVKVAALRVWKVPSTCHRKDRFWGAFACGSCSDVGRGQGSRGDQCSRNLGNWMQCGFQNGGGGSDV